MFHRFTGGTDGGDPQGDLTFDQSGNIYGTTTSGGVGYGVVYELTPSSEGWVQNVLYSFQGGDGVGPYGGVVFDPAGNLYGVTLLGGPYGSGTVYQLSPSGTGWREKVLYGFTGGSDGNEPYGGLIIDAKGNLYGTTIFGGDPECGTVFELTPAAGLDWTFNQLYAFQSGSCYSGSWDKLSMDAAGNLYGTIYSGGFGCGSVFKLTPSAGSWTYASLHDFTCGDDGANPISIVTFDENGNLYGTAKAGGRYGDGVVWEITP